MFQPVIPSIIRSSETAHTQDQVFVNYCQLLLGTGGSNEVAVMVSKITDAVCAVFEPLMMGG